jgi:hypothetical protein
MIIVTLEVINNTGFAGDLYKFEAYENLFRGCVQCFNCHKVAKYIGFLPGIVMVNESP